jgi:Concanavalin A-like lectin/glucanases superfamily
MLTGVALSATLIGCLDETIHATTSRGPADVDHPVAWFRLNEPTRIGHDLSSHNSDAITVDVAVVADPARGLVADLNPGVLAIKTPVRRDFTITLWLKTSQAGPNQTGWVMGPRILDADIPGLALDFGLSLSLDKLAFGVGDPVDLPRDQTSMKSVRGVVDGEWHHIAITRSGDTGMRQIFIDGVLDSQLVALPGDLVLPALIKVGQLVPTNPPSPPLRARVSDLRFFDTVLQASVIAFLATP